MLYVELTAQGLVQGAIYALIALGLTLVYGLLRILHVAHAALFTLGAYVGVIVCNASGSHRKRFNHLPNRAMQEWKHGWVTQISRKITVNGEECF